jgi:hypothetical protein
VSDNEPPVPAETVSSDLCRAGLPKPVADWLAELDLRVWKLEQRSPGPEPCPGGGYHRTVTCRYCDT